MDPNSTNSHHLARPKVSPEIEAVGREFVDGWLADNNQRIEPFLKKVPEALRPEAQDVLIRLEIYLRSSDGEHVASEEYKQRFPACDELLESAILREDESITASCKSVQPGGDNSTIGMARDFDVLPEEFGRYQVKRVLGTGGFGIVCLALDTQLDRHVALKFARASRFRNQQEMENLIREAQTAAQLEHPGIVAVHDVIQQDEFVGIVQQLVDGRDLREELEEGRPTPTRTAELLIAICGGVAFAHSRGFVHRDLKPANILIDQNGTPHISDFGLAIHESFQRQRRGDKSGTPSYMSPELVRGETHRIDGRSDIWSLGVILYLMLTGHKPFSGETRAELFDEIKHREPKPPRQIRPDIPAELDRICLKCLAKPLNERYATANDVANELRRWLQDEASGTSAESGFNQFTPVVPKGLRSFDADDAEFYLQLVPGPRGRRGFPDKIRAWKSRIERTGKQAEPIGLLYGPSGCGKSSFVKAGLIPNLAPFVRVIHVEATAADTEVRLIKALRTNFEEIPTELSLPELFHSLREGEWSTAGQRILIVIDQFEQWLHNRSAYPNTELVEALRHCDGDQLQCLLLVRDDFWLATSRFLKALEIDLVEGKNASLVDLFDKPHARKVLTMYGQGYGRLGAELDSTEEEFIELAVDELAEDDRIICVRLSLFAEMIKGKSWTPATLRKMGGASGVGVAFLEETFSAKNAPPEHRLHAQAARNVLGALLPASSVEIRGNMRSRQELLHISGYAGRPGSFDDLLRILDKELRLITPTDPEGIGDPEHAPGASRNYYQLTHDFLVVPLRKWLNQKQRETVRGRAELRLDDRCATWTRAPENRYLPSLPEYINIRTLTRPSGWSEKERKLMRTADRFYSLRGIVGLAAVVVLALVGWRMYANGHSATLVKRLLESETVDAPAIVDEMTGWRSYVEPRLLAVDVADDPRKQLHVNLALAHRPEIRSQLWDQLLNKARASDIPFIAEAMTPTQAELDQLWDTLREPANPATNTTRLRAGAALARWIPDDVKWQDVSFNLAGALLDQNSLSIWKWTEALSPVREQLSRAMVAHLAEWQYGETNEISEPDVVVSVLREYVGDSTEFFAFLESRLDEYDFRTLVGDDPASDVAQYDELSQKQANIAAILAGLGQLKTVLPLLEFDRNERTRALLIEQFASFGVESADLTDEIARQLNPDIRAGLWLSLGQYVIGDTAVADSDLWLEMARNEFLQHPEARVHSAAEWLIRKMGHDPWLREQCVGQTSTDYPPGQTWRTNGQKQTMLRIAAPGKFIMSYGRTVSIDYDFEVSAKEISLGQFSEFEEEIETDSRLISEGPYDDPELNRQRPATDNVVWFMAADYCNWLSKQEGLQPCYISVTKEDGSEIKYTTTYGHDRPQLQLADNYASRSGYRLPLESEWEYLSWPHCINEMHTDAFVQSLANYEWTGITNDGQFATRSGGRLKPGQFGSFDLFGNAREFCSDAYGSLDGKLSGLIQMEPGMPYLDPIAFAKQFPDALGADSIKLEKGAGVTRRDLEDHRSTVDPIVSRAPQQGFRLVRIIANVER